MSPQYHETGERLAVLETDMAHLKAASVRTEAMVHAIHTKIMQGAGAVGILKQGGSWVMMLLAAVTGSTFTALFHKFFN